MTNIMLPEAHRIIRILKETEAEYTFRVAYDGETKHGQFFQLSIPKVGEAPISVSGRGDGYVEFTIRRVGRLTEGIFGLSEGNVLFMRGPYGNAFPVEQFERKNLVVICGGTGMAPVKTTLNYFYDNPSICKDVYLIAGFKDIHSVLFTEELEKFAKRFHTTYCLDNTEAEGFRKGFVTAYIKEIPFDQMEDYNVVIVGPPAMMRFSAIECMKHGVDAGKIWVSFERKMSCAVGKCGHCKINETYVCLEGPVFNYRKAQNLFD
ncbi:MAG: anaerobic sulfite reductase subunit AsrB [Clostridiales bacterium]|nr:anaerobic sulfite reductase subunit AsrB [Clostridiales bacterium]